MQRYGIITRNSGKFRGIIANLRVFDRISEDGKADLPERSTSLSRSVDVICRELHAGCHELESVIARYASSLDFASEKLVDDRHSYSLGPRSPI